MLICACTEKVPRGGEAMVNENLLKSEIAKNGITMGELATKIGISRTSMSLKVKNRRSFTLDEANEICKILNITDKNDICLIFLN